MQLVSQFKCEGAGRARSLTQGVSRAASYRRCDRRWAASASARTDRTSRLCGSVFGHGSGASWVRSVSLLRRTHSAPERSTRRADGPCWSAQAVHSDRAHGTILRRAPVSTADAFGAGRGGKYAQSWNPGSRGIPPGSRAPRRDMAAGAEPSRDGSRAGNAGWSRGSAMAIGSVPGGCRQRRCSAYSPVPRRSRAGAGRSSEWQVIGGFGIPRHYGRALLRAHQRACMGNAPECLIDAGCAVTRTDRRSRVSSIGSRAGRREFGYPHGRPTLWGARWPQTWIDPGQPSANVPLQQTGGQCSCEAAGDNSYRSSRAQPLARPAAELKSVIRAASARRPAGFQCQLSIGKYRTHVAMLPRPTSEGFT